MNNKLFARIAAAAISVTMLGTAVFATDAVNPTLTVDGEAATLSFMSGETNLLSEKVAAGADQVTMMSYLVGADATYEACDYADETTTPMIALDQVAANEVMGSVGVLASKLTNAFPKVVVRSGDSLGGGYKWLFERTTTPGGETIVTVMNGTTATNLTADADGYVTLPSTAEFDKTSPAGYTFKLYSWVPYTGTTEGTEILIPTEATEAAGTIGTDDIVITADKAVKVKASSLEGKTLYAKFATTVARGDLNEDGSIDTLDFNPIAFKYKGVAVPTLLKNVGSAIYEGSTTLKGDLNEDGSIDTLDFNPIAFKYKGITVPTLLKNVDKPYYVVNK